MGQGGTDAGSEGAGAELRESLLEVLDVYAERIRAMAAELKTHLRHISDEAKAMDLDVMEGAAVLCVRPVASHDRIGEHGLTDGAMFPVEPRWALRWEDIAEHAETARRLREGPEHFEPVLMGDFIEATGLDLLARLKEAARAGA